MNTVIISGSARRDNNTMRVAYAIRDMLDGNADIIDFTEFDLPHSNEGFLGKKQLSDFQKHLINSIEKADLLIVLTPEYNFFPSAEIISMVHHLASYEYGHVFDEMVAAFVGVSTGSGGRMPAIQLSYVFDKVFNYLNLNSITSPKKYESQFTTQCVGEDGTLLNNQAYNDGLKKFVQYSVNVAQRWHSK